MGDPKDVASAAERLLRSYQAQSSAGYGHIPNLNMAQQQQQAAAAAAFQSAQLAAAAAAAYSNPLAAAAVSPFYNPYAAMYGFGGTPNPFAAAGMGMMSPDYMMGMAALQQPQQQFHHQNQAFVSTTESFSDVLNKIQHTPSTSKESVGDKKMSKAEASLSGESPSVSAVFDTGCSGSGSSVPWRSETAVSTESDASDKMCLGQMTSGGEPAESRSRNLELSSLDTLAAVATSLKNEEGNEKVEMSAAEMATQERAHSDTDPSSSASRAASTSTSASRGRSPLEASGEMALPPKKRRIRSSFEPISPEQLSTESESEGPKVKKVRKTEDGDGENDGATTEAETERSHSARASDIQMDPKLLNASAMAWAALSNQIFLGMQMGMQKEMLKQLVGQSSSNLQSQELKSSAGRKRMVVGQQGRGRPATISSDDTRSPSESKDHVDDTIESVIRQHCHSAVTEDGRRMKAGAGRRPGRPGKRTPGVRSAEAQGSSAGCGMTVREQLALRRAQDGGAPVKIESPPKLEKKEEALPLDLSKKTVVKQEFPVKSEVESTDSLSGLDFSRPSSSDRSSESPSYPKKRKVAEEHLIRVPFEHGWRRQTCIRTMTANGVRGDVIYYAPCGKRLGSYAEVIRYLSKHQITDLSRDNFSFSSKVLAGEFLQIKQDSSKNGIAVKLDEKEVLNMIQDLGAETNNRRVFRRSQESQMRRSNRNKGLSAAGRLSEVSIQQRQLLKAMEMRKADRDKESQLRAQRILDAMRRAKEQEIKKQHLSLLQKQAKQEEQYYRQMLLMGLEREKMRQQVLAAKALESRKRQEDRQRIIAERLIRQEEKVAARNAQQLRIKQLRQPIDDLDLIDGKELPIAHRIPGLKVSGKAFADLLMVMEFLNNFGAVLKIDMNDVPSMSEVQSGLRNDSNHIKHVRKLARILLTLVLEYPGLPPGPQGKTFLGQSVRELKITRDNMSELLRMFLRSRDAEGVKLGNFLTESSFDSLDAEEKAEILAFMCNELLYCRNVVREIEGSIEETARMKGEKWIREVKIRSLRGIQAKKRMDAAAKRTNQQWTISRSASGTEMSETKEEEDFSGQVESTERSGTPNSPSAASESETEMKSLAEVKIEARRELIETSESDCQRAAAGTPIKKLPAAANSQPDAVTEEEKKMSAEDLEKVIEGLGKEAEDLMERIADKTCRVRAQPYGQDRYHRFYWVLPNLGGMLLESVESGKRNNPACAVKESQLSPSVESEVKSLVSDLLDRTCGCEMETSRGGESVLDLSLLKQAPPSHRDANAKILPEEMQRGWWIVKSRDELEELKNSLQLRGIRERVLHRNLTRYSEYIKKQSFLKTKPITLKTNVGTCWSSDDAEKLCLLRVLNAVRLLEEKVFHANIHMRHWRPPELKSDIASSLMHNWEEEIDDEGSKSSSSSSDVPSDAKWEETLDPSALIKMIKDRMSKVEFNVERRYLASPFNQCRSVIPDVVLNGGSRAVSPGVNKEEGSNQNELIPPTVDFRPIDSEGENSNGVEMGSRSDEIPVQLERWRSGLEAATNSSQLMLCLLQMDANIAWEKSIMRASCQICQSGDNESKLLLCDGCDMGYHTYCFKPKMEDIPGGDWFCPDCISRASEKECCLLCCKQGGSFALCSECTHSFHPACVDLPVESESSCASGNLLKKRSLSTPTLSWNSSSWKCPACSKHKSSITSEPSRQSKAEENEPETAAGIRSAVNRGLAKKKCTGINGKKAKDARASPRQSTESTPPVSNNCLTVEELCSVMFAELDAHKDSWPFKLPVDMKAFPLYKKVIRKPMDLSSIKSKLNSHKYGSGEEFSEDVKLIFGNCKIFNEDDSPVAKAGRSLKRYFLKRWKELREGFPPGNGQKMKK